MDRAGEVLSILKMLAGFDDDIARDCTRAKNRAAEAVIITINSGIVPPDQTFIPSLFAVPFFPP